MGLTRTLMGLLTPGERRGAGLMVLLVCAAAIVEAVGVAMIMPFLAVLADRDLARSHDLLRRAHDGLGFASVDAFLVFLGLLAFAAVVGSAALRTVATFATNRFAAQCRHSLGARLLESYLRRPYAFFLGRHSGDMAKTVLSEVETVVGRAMRPAANLVARGFVLAALVLLLVMVDPLLAAAGALLTLPVYWLLFLRLRARLEAEGARRLAANRARFTAAGEVLAGVKDIKLLGRERAYLGRFVLPSRRMARAEAMAATLAQVPRYAVEALAFGGVILLTLVLILRSDGTGPGALGGVLPVLGVYVFAGYRLLPAVQGIYEALSLLRFAAPAVRNVEAELEGLASLPPLPSPGVLRLPLRRSLRLEGVGYTYPGAARPTLAGIDLDFPAGGSTGIVGTTGAGKTTLVDLILGLLEPGSGRILIDGAPLGPADLRGWQANIGYIPQSIFLADASVAENIALGIPRGAVDPDRVADCARLARLHDFVAGELPGGYATPIGERGVRLSGGQRQRIGIARALYHDPALLVLDEATSALDPRTEAEVLAELRGLSGQKTVITIAHRLSAVRTCDRIVVLDRGRVAGIGSFETLVATNAVFRRLADAA